MLGGKCDAACVGPRTESVAQMHLMISATVLVWSKNAALAQHWVRMHPKLPYQFEWFHKILFVFSIYSAWNVCIRNTAKHKLALHESSAKTVSSTSIKIVQIRTLLTQAASDSTVSRQRKYIYCIYRYFYLETLWYPGQEKQILKQEKSITLWTDATVAVWPLRSNISQPKSAQIKILVCKQVSKAYISCFLCYITAELLQGTGTPNTV